MMNKDFFALRYERNEYAKKLFEKIMKLVKSKREDVIWESTQLEKMDAVIQFQQ